MIYTNLRYFRKRLKVKNKTTLEKEKKWLEKLTWNTTRPALLAIQKLEDNTVLTSDGYRIHGIVNCDEYNIGANETKQSKDNRYYIHENKIAKTVYSSTWGNYTESIETHNFPIVKTQDILNIEYESQFLISIKEFKSALKTVNSWHKSTDTYKYVKLYIGKNSIILYTKSIERGDTFVQIGINGNIIKFEDKYDESGERIHPHNYLPVTIEGYLELLGEYKYVSFDGEFLYDAVGIYKDKDSVVIKINCDEKNPVCRIEHENYFSIIMGLSK